MKKRTLVQLFKFANYGLVFVLLVVTIYTINSKSPNGLAFAAETTSSQFGMALDQSKAFLNSYNMSPGDKISAPLTISNIGQLDFAYDVTAVLQSGALMFSNLDLIIADSSGKIRYNGKLKDLNELDLGILGKQAKETYTYTVCMPKDSGNEYQGQSTQVTFLFNATEHPPYIGEGQIVWDPPLEKPDVNVRRGNVMPIKFHLIANGTFETVKRGIDLVITGIYNGKPVSYTFSIANGTLSWEEHGLNKPHYSLLFDTGVYPVDFDTYYKATAKYGTQILGTTEFKSGK